MPRYVPVLLTLLLALVPCASQAQEHYTLGPSTE